MIIKTFELTEEHLKLIQNMYVSWEDCEYGAPSIDCKRPYGNSDVEFDIAETLGWNVDDEEGLTQYQSEKAFKLHKETQIALQIVLCTKSFKAGIYEKEDEYCNRSWFLKNNKIRA